MIHKDLCSCINKVEDPVSKQVILKMKVYKHQIIIEILNNVSLATSNIFMYNTSLI